MTTLSERMKEALEGSGASPADLARACQVKPPSVSNWLSGETKSLKASTAIRAAEFLGVNQLWLTEGRGPMRPSSAATKAEGLTSPVASILGGVAAVPLVGIMGRLFNLHDHPDLLEIPRVKFKLSAGVTGYAVEVENGNGKPVFFRKDWFDLHGYVPEKMFAVRVSGPSMETSLWDGDLVVINTDDSTPQDGDVFAINFEGELVIKRLRRDAGEWWATSDNADQRRYSPKRCTEDVKIIGRVVYKQSERI